MDIHFIYYHIIIDLIHRIHLNIFLLNEEDILIFYTIKDLVNMIHLDIFIIFMGILKQVNNLILKHNIFSLHI